MEHSEWNLTWGEGLGFGIPELDAADRRLGTMAQELNDAIDSGRDTEAIQHLMDRLLLEAIGHFEYEERVLTERAYPLPKGHAALHLQMRAELEHAMDVFHDMKAHATWAAYGHLVTQLIVEHFRQETISYRKFLHSTPAPGAQGTQ